MTSTDSEGSHRDLIQLEAQGKTPKDVFKEKLQDLYQQGMKTGPAQGTEKRPTSGRQPGVKPPPPQRGVSIGSRSIPVKHRSPHGQNSSPVGNNQIKHKDNNVNGDHRPLIKSNPNLQKPESPNPDSYSSSKDAELYQTYINRQKNIAAGVKYPVYQSSSGTSTPTSSLDGRDSDSSRENVPVPGPMSKSYSKAEIRHLLQQNMMHKQNPPVVAPVRAPQQQPPQGYTNGGGPRAPGQPYAPTGNLVRTGPNPVRSNISANDCRGPKPQIACKPIVHGDCPSQSMHPTSVSARMMPSDYQGREMVYGSQSRLVERGASQPDQNNRYQQQQHRACTSGTNLSAAFS